MYSLSPSSPLWRSYRGSARNPRCTATTQLRHQRCPGAVMGGLSLHQPPIGLGNGHAHASSLTKSPNFDFIYSISRHRQAWLSCTLPPLPTTDDSTHTSSTCGGRRIAFFYSLFVPAGQAPVSINELSTVGCANCRRLSDRS